MSPVATTTCPARSPSSPHSPAWDPNGIDIQPPLPRRPSPWHELAHSLSTTSLPPSTRRPSASSLAQSHTPTVLSTAIAMIEPVSSSPSPALSSSQVLRLLLSPSPRSKTTPLILFEPTPAIVLGGGNRLTRDNWPPRPRVAAERDKEGNIEYKLKLIDPTQERFDKLVTQLMWRLKEGQNEAIYEIGLADDGTVIGLSQAEMDASLRTLELMASEVGATVIILKEIVLLGTAPVSPSAMGPKDSPTLSASMASSFTSLSSASLASADTPSPSPTPSPVIRGAAMWSHVQRPSLEPHDSLHDKTSTISSLFNARANTVEPDTRLGIEVDVSVPSPTTAGPPAMAGNASPLSRTGNRGIPPLDRPVPTQKQVIYQPADFIDMDAESDEDAPLPMQEESGRRARRRWRQQELQKTDEDVAPFHLDMEDPVPVSDVVLTGRRGGAGGHARRVAKMPSAEEIRVLSRKAQNKINKATARQEARRLSLLMGDGMSMSMGPGPNSGPDDAVPSPALPHQPFRPSTLRLANPSVPVPDPPNQPDGEGDEDDSLFRLFQQPLDSLSLSFANISLRSITPPGVGEELGHEMICVEALIVRKVQHDHGEELWGYGGHEDGWGFGAADEE